MQRYDNSTELLLLLVRATYIISVHMTITLTVIMNISIASTSDDRPPHHFLPRRCCHPSRRYNASCPLLALQRPHRLADTSYDRTRPTRTPGSEFCRQVAALLPRHSAQGCRDRREKCCAEKNGAPGCKREGAHSSHCFNDPIKPAHTTSHRTCATTIHGSILLILAQRMDAALSLCVFLSTSYLHKCTST